MRVGFSDSPDRVPLLRPWTGLMGLLENDRGPMLLRAPPRLQAPHRLPTFVSSKKTKVSEILLRRIGSTCGPLKAHESKASPRR